MYPGHMDLSSDDVLIIYFDVTVTLEEQCEIFNVLMAILQVVFGRNDTASEECVRTESNGIMREALV